MIASIPESLDPAVVGVSVVLFVTTAAAVFIGFRPVRALILRQEEQFSLVLRRSLLLDVQPRMATVLSLVAGLILAIIGAALLGGALGFALGAGVGCLLPRGTIWLLRRHRLQRLEGQLVAGIQALASGVRAGLNLVQAMGTLAKDGPDPMRQEFVHLLREYEYGMPLEEAMDNAVERIGSADFALLFSALQTHRERGGNLGDTLDRIADSIREIQRLENRIKALTAQGRATARWLAGMPPLVLGILYMIEPAGVRMMFTDTLGNLILVFIVLLNVAGFLWIRKLVAIDI